MKFAPVRRDVVEFLAAKLLQASGIGLRTGNPISMAAQRMGLMMETHL